MMRFLLNHGFEVSFTDRWKKTAIFYATRSKHAEVVRLLVEHGANIVAKSDLGVTPRRLLRDRPEEFLEGIRSFLAGLCLSGCRNQIEEGRRRRG